MPARSAIVRIGLGILLLAAAVLKLYGLSVSAVPRVGWFAQPWVQLLAAEWELVLGAWLLSGVYPRLSWLATVVTFVAFAGVSGYLGWVGVASCGCLGAIQTNPWWAFGADVIAVALLTANRPTATVRTSDREHSTAEILKWSAGSIVALAVLIAVGVAYFGSLGAAVARLRDEPVTVDPLRVDFGTGRPNQILTEPVTVVNRSGRRVRVIGGTSDCSCVTTSELPRTLEPGERCDLLIGLKVPSAESGLFERSVELWTDDPAAPRVRFAVACRVE